MTLRIRDNVLTPWQIQEMICMYTYIYIYISVHVIFYYVVWKRMPYDSRNNLKIAYYLNMKTLKCFCKLEGVHAKI